MIHFQGLIALLAIFALTMLPVSLAARFAGAGKPGLLHSTVAVVLGGIASWWVLHLMGGTLAGLALAYLAVCAVYAAVLRVSLAGAIGVSVIAFFLQVVIAVAIAHFGVALPGIERHLAQPVLHRR
ncbi:MAG TPA: hypothetical protein VK753_13140 [Xanthomonadaceae bacterium]|nr:hypothetical protein [Xanthomonadaceae bacterium]